MLGGRYAVILLAALALPAAISAQTGDNSGGGKAAAAQSTEKAKRAPPPVATADGEIYKGEDSDKGESDPYAKERNEREKRDIVAQEATAKWAKAAFWAMVLQTLVAGAALVALLCDLRQNRTNAERQLRAYVHLTEIKHVGLSPDQPFTARGNIFNKGQTPAYNVKVNGRASLKHLPVDETAFILDGQSADASVSTLAPGEPMHIPVTYPNAFAAETIAAIQNGMIGLFFFGTITYDDIYGKSHTTNFRALWATDRNTFSSCESGNSAD